MIPDRIKLIKADITKIKVDAIVNAANSSLLGGGGVDGAIHRAGGPAILEECRQIRSRQGGCKTGQAVITSAGNLQAKYVVHTVGPVWQGGSAKENELLASAYLNSVKLAGEYAVRSIAFPNISTGIYGFPKKEAAAIAVYTVKAFIANHQQPEEIIFVCYDDDNYTIYKNLLAE
ncbi:MAG: O-acetyl-ADP-ribose deacetylase [Chitinophagaceae bacterium]